MIGQERNGDIVEADDVGWPYRVHAWLKGGPMIVLCKVKLT